MDEVTRHKGRCLCGAVRFEAEIAEAQMGACHCGMCRRWSGGVLLTLSCRSLEIVDGDALSVYASSDWGERCFCRHCGSSLIWRSTDGRHIAASVQAFDDPGAFPFTSQIFIDEKPASYHFREATTEMTGAQVRAAFPPEAQS